MPKVSVTIVTFNQEDLIEETIASVLSQSYRDIEVIIADDCSTDGTCAASERALSGSCVPWRIIRQERNGGVTVNTAAAVAAASGEYIAFLGGDDTWDPTKLDTCVKILEEDGRVSLVGHAMRYMDGIGHFNGQVQRSVTTSTAVEWRDLLLGRRRFLGSSAVVRNPRGAVVFDARVPVASDLLFFPEFLKVHGPGVLLPDVLGSYRVHSRSVSVSRRRQIIEDGLLCLALFEAKFPDARGLVASCRSRVMLGYAHHLLQRDSRELAREVFWSLLATGQWPRAIYGLLKSIV